MKIKYVSSNNGVSPLNSHNVSQQTSGFGYVIIPEGVDRDNYVKTCFRNCRITIVDDSNGNVFRECYITNEALQNIKFPRVVGEKGIPVAWTSQPTFTLPMIIGTFIPIEKVNIRDDEEFNIVREWDKGLFEIRGSAKDGSLFVKVRGEEAGYIQIDVEGNENALVQVNSSGSIQASANKNVDVTAYTELNAKVKDPELKNESGIKINKGEITLQSSYGEDGGDSSFKTIVTAEGFTTEETIGDVKYKHTVNEGKAETTFEDCTIRFEDKKVTLSQSKMVIEMSDGKLSITNSGTGLNELLTKIVDAIATLTVSTAVGPSGTPLPPTIQKTTELNSLLKQFFNK